MLYGMLVYILLSKLMTCIIGFDQRDYCSLDRFIVTLYLVDATII